MLSQIVIKAAFTAEAVLKVCNCIHSFGLLSLVLHKDIYQRDETTLRVCEL